MKLSAWARMALPCWQRRGAKSSAHPTQAPRRLYQRLTRRQVPTIISRSQRMSYPYKPPLWATKNWMPTVSMEPQRIHLVLLTINTNATQQASIVKQYQSSSGKVALSHRCQSWWWARVFKSQGRIIAGSSRLPCQVTLDKAINPCSLW